MFIASLLGNLHPAIVHLPIGILLLAGLLEWMMIFRRFRSHAPLIPLITAIGALAAILACITGLTLEATGDYNGEAVDRHKWAGLSTALIASVYFVVRRKGGHFERYPNRARWGSLLMLASVTITGHWGGDLTHGSGFLWKGVISVGSNVTGDASAEFRPVADVMQARAWPDLVSQVMQAKCVSCHGPSKQKGGLRLDDPEHILKGGKNGRVISPGYADQSEIFKRIMLPPEDEYHMPPEDKPQLSSQDRILIEWWIANGADLKRKVSEIGIDDSTLAVLKSYEAGQQGVAQVESAPIIPVDPVAKADPAVIESIRNQGVVILPVDPSNGYLTANFVNAQRPSDSLLKLLEPLADQLIWLKLSGSDLTDAGCETIARLKRLTRLHIDHTRITDAGLKSLLSLDQLQKLNLSGDSVSVQGLKQLVVLKALRSLNLWQTRVGQAELADLIRSLPSVRIDTGGYQLPFLPSDTMIVKDTRKK
jgi:uncharacterized membrane protein